MTAPSQDRCPTRLPASTGGRWGPQTPADSATRSAIAANSQAAIFRRHLQAAASSQAAVYAAAACAALAPLAHPAAARQARRSESPAHPPGSLRLGRWYACGAHVWPLPRGWGTAKAAETTRQRPKPAASSPRRRSARTCPQRACPKDAELPPSGARQCS